MHECGEPAQKNLEAGKYDSPLEFEKDVALIWDNCMTYNAVSQRASLPGARGAAQEATNLQPSNSNPRDVNGCPTCAGRL